MAQTIYLAMTGAEFRSVAPLPPCLGWMACHFSPYGTGLSNLPHALPPGAMLILNDRIPIRGHDPQRIAHQLEQTCQRFGCRCILLDFQRPGDSESQALAACLINAPLPCPVAVSQCYGDGLSCPIFLPPCPHHVALAEHIAPWQGREIWLDLSRDAETITLRKEGSAILPLPLGELPTGGHCEERLHCHYRIETGDDFARFTLWRTRKDLEDMAKEAEELGILTLVGLYQELQEN